MQQIAIIASAKDPAGINIRNNLIGLFDFEMLNENIENQRFSGHQKSSEMRVSSRTRSQLTGFFSEFDNNQIYQYNKIENKIIRLYLINDDLIFAENLDKKINADFFIFASKHRSKENTPSFAVHPIGNWSKADFGGEERKLCPSSAVLLKNFFVELNKIGKNSGYEITMEATHHGPYVEKPAVFVEIGSTENEWNDIKSGEIIAKTIMSALKNENKDYKIAIAIGGPHYCESFNKILLRTDIAISHICPKYHLEKLDEELIKQSIEKTIEKVDFVLLDWKGLGKEKQGIVEMLNNLNLEIKRTDQILR